MTTDDAGQATMLAVVWVVVAVVGIAVCAAVGVVAHDRAVARTAADAAALAAVIGGDRAAVEAADRHEATLVDLTWADDGSVEVRVRRGRAEAAARAVPSGGLPVVGGGGGGGGVGSW